MKRQQHRSSLVKSLRAGLSGWNSECVIAEAAVCSHDYSKDNSEPAAGVPVAVETLLDFSPQLPSRVGGGPMWIYLWALGLSWLRTTKWDKGEWCVKGTRICQIFTRPGGKLRERKLPSVGWDGCLLWLHASDCGHGAFHKWIGGSLLIKYSFWCSHFPIHKHWMYCLSEVPGVLFSFPQITGWGLSQFHFLLLRRILRYWTQDIPPLLR